MTTAQTSINVVYEFIDGAHFFTSTDPVAQGLCVASSDLEAAYVDVTIQLQELLAWKHTDCDVVVEHEIPYEAFLDRLMNPLRTSMAARKRAGIYLGHKGVTPRPSALRVHTKNRHLESAAA